MVATCNRAHLLEAMVHAVLSDPTALEMIVVVDRKDDLTSVDVLTRLQRTNDRLRHIQTDRRRHMGALESGVLVAKGDIVLLLDDDVLPISRLATGHARWHARRDDLVVVGNMPVATSHGGPMEVASRIYAQAYDGHRRSLMGGSPVLDSLWLGNVSLRRDNCLRVGLTSRAFTTSYHMDRDFGYRLSDAGLTGVFDETLQAIHLHSRSPSSFLHDARRQGAGLRMLHEVHPDRLGSFSPTLVMNNVSFPLTIAFRAIVVHSHTRVAASEALMGAAIMAGRLHLQAAETFLAKVAQHVMQWHGAVVAEPV